MTAAADRRPRILAAATRPRILVAATTPGAAKSLAAAVIEGRRFFDFSIVSSANPRHGMGGETFAAFGLETSAVEDIAADYRPYDVTAAAADAVLDAVSPSAVLTGAVQDTGGALRPFEDVVASQARSRGLPALQLVDGWEIWFPRAWSDGVADKWLVFDELARDLMVKRGAPPDRIEIVGYPESLFTPAAVNAEIRADVRRRFLNSETDRLILYLGQLTDGNLKTVSWVRRAAGPEDMILIQPHPRDTRGGDVWLDACRGARAAVSPLTAETALHGADCAVSHYSLSAFTASRLGLPTILTLLDEDVPDSRAALGVHPITMLGGAVEAHSPEDLAARLSEMTPPPQSYINKVRRSAEGSAARILAAVETAVQAAPPSA